MGCFLSREVYLQEKKSTKKKDRRNSVPYSSKKNKRGYNSYGTGCTDGGGDYGHGGGGDGGGGKDGGMVLMSGAAVVAFSISAAAVMDDGGGDFGGGGDCGGGGCGGGGCGGGGAGFRTRDGGIIIGLAAAVEILELAASAMMAVPASTAVIVDKH
ncbi:uncharacterized protein LOC133800363 [Humulus lupulus]|uniref:uncharacterized protein LOC133800363 n=1 Tax=Humulus lupulus TaxID=3486 RepID=UPI002B41171F|nr:uncharacterized protein LOC133800363 [Humulus lupulus]